MSDLENDQTAVNDQRTQADSGTKLTQPRSAFDLEDARRNLIAMRVRFGANTPKGHACSNLIEQVKNMAGATGDQKASLHKSISKSIAKLNAA